MDSARARGDWENTIVVFTSDHGFSEGQHGYWGKHNMWDTSMHVPLFIKPARVTEAAKSDVHVSDATHRKWPVSISRVTEHVDIYPTLCDLAGFSIPEHCEGRSLVPLLENPQIKWKDAALSHRKHMWHDRLQVYDIGNSLRTSRYRYTEYLDTSGQVLGTELFDYEKDPLETRNFAESAAYRTARTELAEWLHRAVSRA